MFFGPGSGLYAVYHAADAANDNNQGLLISSPIGHEYIRSHRLVRQIATQLALRGFHVFRFDYAGQGNSDGDFIDTNLSVWKENLVSAKAELKALSGVRKISVLGIQLGATIALLANKDAGLKIRKHYYWDPVFDGNAYIQKMKNAQALMMADYTRFIEAPIVAQSDRYVEAIGFRYGFALLDELRKVNYERINEYLDRGVFSVLVGPDQFADMQCINSSAEFAVTSAQNTVEWWNAYKVESTIVAPQEVSKLVNMVR